MADDARVDEFTPAEDPKIQRILELVMQLAAGDLEARGEVGTDESAHDAVILGLNMLGEELAMADQERGEAERWLANKTIELQTANIALERSNAELQQFAYIASHDLKEPLRMMASFSELLRRNYGGQFDDRADKYIEFIVDGARRMQSLIDDMLKYSRVQTHGGVMQPVSLEAVFDVVQVNLSLAIRDSAAILTRDPLPTIPADKGQMVQLLQNLVANAIKFRAGRQPEVHVSATRRNGDVLIAVRDNGIGIAPKDIERVFHIFKRLHSRTAYPGNGIGLAVCQRVAARHGGSIRVESELGEGSTFTVTIPAPQ